MTILLTLGLTLGMTFLYRMHGGMSPKLPWKFDEIFIGMVVASPILLIDWRLALIAFAGAAVLKVKGHGQYMNFEFFPPWPRRINPETWDIFLTPLFGADPRTSSDWTDLHHATKAKRIRDYGIRKLYLRCLSGLTIAGASVSIGLVGVLLYLHYWAAALVVLALFGLSKPLGYAIGWKFNPKVNEELDEPTEWGEAISGLGAGLAVSYVFVTVVQVGNYLLTL